ncbi:HAD family hydrolase [Mobilitalea sibirica]|uniref:HAD family hydrolase n=1 Tax=Mobilitalea sibirica TaxID=1462919 RepID=A0A8J7KUA7_9FIRM|nr:HAD family hydrolase [Mobilitalea sibirica]MBH1942276.1 HAD family hydrolase [Mobilitalea sibirica]
MKYNTVIFDLDGTLLNTLDDLRDSLNEILVQKGFPSQSYDEVKRYVGNGVRNLIRQSIPTSCSEDEVTLYLEEFKENYRNNMQNKTRPYNGIMELLLDLHRYNYKMAIVSNKYDTAVKSLAKTYFGTIIPVAIGETAQIKRKPAPDSVFTAVKELGSELKNTIFVGDSETDIMTAKNAGIPCIGVTWGFRCREVLRKTGADYLIDTPKELLTLI